MALDFELLRVGDINVPGFGVKAQRGGSAQVHHGDDGVVVFRVVALQVEWKAANDTGTLLSINQKFVQIQPLAL